MEQNIFRFITAAFHEAFDFVQPKLSNYLEFSKNLSQQVKVKKHNNVQYNFDLELDKIMINKIKQFDISGRIFSEESGSFSFGENKYRVVYDPFCNSSLASRTFYEAAAGISVFDYNYNFITSAIMDYQTGIMGIVEDEKTDFYQIQTQEKINFNPQRNKKLEDAWTVITLEKHKERENLEKVNRILKNSKRVIISSGHIYWLKLATGMIDAYLDPFGGEPLYEMFASTVAQYNGCIVTDKSGKDFDPTENLKIFEKNPEYIYYPVAANNKTLHNEILSNF